MSHPWQHIALSDYENHMQLDSVQQLQTLNQIMNAQFTDFPCPNVMILGVAGGNGLEHILPDTKQLFAVDINADYLQKCAERYRHLPSLVCVQADLSDVNVRLPQADLVVANLLIEYIGYTAFQRCLGQIQPRYVSCVIQQNTDDGFVSDSPYLHHFDALSQVHHLIHAHALTQAMHRIGYHPLAQQQTPLPNGKALLRLDYQQSA